MKLTLTALSETSGGGMSEQRLVIAVPDAMNNDALQVVRNAMYKALMTSADIYNAEVQSGLEGIKR